MLCKHKQNEMRNTFLSVVKLYGLSVRNTDQSFAFNVQSLLSSDITDNRFLLENALPELKTPELIHF